MDDVRFNFCSKVVHANKGQFGFKLWAITLIQIEIFQNLFCKNCSSHIELEDIKKSFSTEFNDLSFQFSESPQ